jgi:CDP-diacylglycerol--glycerol-3-phosphate 3-phosphatidyltransferase
MKITANQVTLLRIIFLPIPCILMYGDEKERVIALVLFVILGLTDYIDGIMARRDGSTPLGKLLDPIADKIFIAVTFIPLLHLGILPTWIVWPIFLREFLVTELRRFTTGKKTDLKVTDLAKIKTTLQMTGFGLILFNDTFPDKGVSILLLSTAFAASVIAWTVMYMLKRNVDSRIKKAAGLTLLGLVVILPCSARTTNMIYGIIILGLTLWSGWQYVRSGIPELIQKGWNAILSLAA